MKRSKSVSSTTSKSSSSNSNDSRTQDTIHTKSFVVEQVEITNQIDENQTKTKDTNLDTKSQSRQSTSNTDPEVKLIDDE